MRHMQHICRIYAPPILPNSTHFSVYFASQLSTYFKKILRYKPTSLIILGVQCVETRLLEMRHDNGMPLGERTTPMLKRGIAHISDIRQQFRQELLQ